MNDKFGLVNKQGKEIHKASLKYLSSFSGEIGIYKVGEYYGLITKQGSYLTDSIYKGIFPRKYSYFLCIRQDDILVILNKEGKEVLNLKTSLKDPILGLAGYSYKMYENDIRLYDNLGLEDYFGINPIHVADIFIGNTFPPRYFSKNSDKVKSSLRFLTFREGMTRFCKKIGNKAIYKFGFMDTKLKVVIPPKYDYVSHFKGAYAIVSKGGKWGVINKQGKKVLAFRQAKYIEQTSQNRFVVYFEDKSCQVIDSDN